MNWDALAATAELLAAIGVIVSLVYLAAQIRHGTLQVAEQSRSQRLTSLADVLSDSRSSDEASSAIAAWHLSGCAADRIFESSMKRSGFSSTI